MLQDIQQIHIQLPKSDSYFLYFLLEANEGISFYSTIPSSIPTPGLVTIECNFHPSTAANVMHLLEQLKLQNLISYNLMSSKTSA